jgi:hypothetical protein
MSDKRYTNEFKSEAGKQVLNMGDPSRKSLPGWGSAPIHCTLRYVSNASASRQYRAWRYIVHSR